MITIFQQRLKDARNAIGISQKELAKRLFISQQAYAKYETGTATPNPEMLSNIASILGVTVDYLVGRDPNASSPIPQSTGGVWIPVLGEIAAGVPIEAVTDIVDYEEITKEMAASGEYFGLKVKGDSMDPQILDSDVVIIKKESSADSGDVVAVLVNGDSATVKRIKIRPEGIMLIPANPKYEAMFYSCDDVVKLPVMILGKVVELRRKF